MDRCAADVGRHVQVCLGQLVSHVEDPVLRHGVASPKHMRAMVGVATTHVRIEELSEHGILVDALETVGDLPCPRSGCLAIAKPGTPGCPVTIGSRFIRDEVREQGQGPARNRPTVFGEGPDQVIVERQAACSPTLATGTGGGVAVCAAAVERVAPAHPMEVEIADSYLQLSGAKRRLPAKLAALQCALRGIGPLIEEVMEGAGEEIPALP